MHKNAYNIKKNTEKRQKKNYKNTSWVVTTDLI